MVWADVNRDGFADLSVIAASGHPSWLHLSDGTTLPEEAFELAPGTESTTSIAWGDWDGDGDLDLALGARAHGVGEEASPATVYEFEDGGLVGLCWSSAELDENEGVAWGDKDGDGDLDLAVVNVHAPDRVYENVPAEPGSACARTFSDESTSIAKDGKSYDVAWADLEGDGDLKLAITRWPNSSDVGGDVVIFGGEGPRVVDEDNLLGDSLSPD